MLGWSSFQGGYTPPVSSIENLTYTALTTSGRAAIYQALLQLNLPPASLVLVPGYHCPTMVAPVILANLKVSFFALRSDGLPDLEGIDASTAWQSRAMLVSHYFGFSQSLAEVRHWCDQRGIALIEDCAHCYFGSAGERPIGAWGDYATASLTKFFPVPEGGLLASATRAITPLDLTPPPLRTSLKGWANLLESAAEHQRLTGLNRALSFLFRHKNSIPQLQTQTQENRVSLAESDPFTALQTCDMARSHQAPLASTKILKIILPRGQSIRQRHQNFENYARYFDSVKGARPLFKTWATPVAPYVFPLWVNQADLVYHALRAQGFPVFRWDRTWPGTPDLKDDVAPLWRYHILQLLCHQDLNEAAIQATSHAVLALLRTHP